MPVKNPLKKIDGGGDRPIMGGLFKMADTFGFSLEDSILECERRGFAPGLPAFVCDAVLAGWKVEKAIERVTSAWRELGRGLLPEKVVAGLRKAAEYPGRFGTKAGRAWA